MSIVSKIEDKGLLKFPAFTGLRIMMMPFRLEDEDTIPDFMSQWCPALQALRDISTVKSGVAYLTVDEAFVCAGETHRRPGLHVDGVGGAWGGGGGHAANGMLVASTVYGCRGYPGTFEGEPGPNGDCAHMREQLSEHVDMQAGRVYWCSPLAVHESVPLSFGTRRQFVRLSMPSTAPWHEGYTVNPKGVLPTGPVEPSRQKFMQFRA